MKHSTYYKSKQKEVYAEMILDIVSFLGHSLVVSLSLCMQDRHVFWLRISRDCKICKILGGVEWPCCQWRLLEQLYLIRGMYEIHLRLQLKTFSFKLLA